MFSRILITILLLFGTSGNNKTVEGILPEHNSKVPNSVPIISPDDTLVPANYSRKATEQKGNHKNTDVASGIIIDKEHFPDARFRYIVSLYDDANTLNHERVDLPNRKAKADTGTKHGRKAVSYPKAKGYD